MYGTQLCVDFGCKQFIRVFIVILRQHFVIVATLEPQEQELLYANCY